MTPSSLVRFFMVIAAIHLATTCPTHAASTSSVAVKKINDSVYVLLPEKGLGSNVGVVISDHGVLLIDAMNPREGSTEKLDNALRTITNKPVKFIINTHSHRDHTGANAFYEAKGATIISQENIRYANANSKAKLHYSQQWYIDNTLTMTFGNQSIVATTAISHTYNDLVVYLPQTNIVFMGDNFGTTWGPNSSEQAAGVLTRVINRIDNKTVVVPGHGILTNKNHLTAYKNNAKIWEEIIYSLADQKISASDIVKNKTIKDLVNYFSGGATTGGYIDEKNLIRRIDRTIEYRPIPSFPIKHPQKYVGVYPQKNGKSLEVVLQDDFLYARIKGEFMTELHPASADKFDFLGWKDGESIQFSLNNEKKITGATFIQPKEKGASE